jgi:hypothetical protein
MNKVRNFVYLVGAYKIASHIYPIARAKYDQDLNEKPVH